MLPTENNSEKSSVLKGTREAKGLTLEIVHEATKIPMDALRAIEEGYSVRILSPFYYRGFIKIYAEFLGLDVAEVFKQYGLDKPAQSTSSATVSVRSKAIRTPEPAGPNVFLETLQEWAAFLVKPKTFKLILKAAGFLLLIFLLVKTGGCIAAHFHKKQARSKHQEVYVPQEKVPEPNNDFLDNKPAAAVPVETKQDSDTVDNENSKVELAVRAARNTWIQVKADGHVVFQMTLSKGSMESWSADNTIELSGKNIERLDLEVNGKHVGSLGGGERRIRKVLITKEGLTVKK